MDDPHPEVNWDGGWMDRGRSRVSERENEGGEDGSGAEG